MLLGADDYKTSMRQVERETFQAGRRLESSGSREEGNPGALRSKSGEGRRFRRRCCDFVVSVVMVVGVHVAVGSEGNLLYPG